MPGEQTWREWMRPQIAEIVHMMDGVKARHRGDTDWLKRVHKAVLASYPEDVLYERKYWPYRVWCSEAKRQVYGNVIECDPNQPDLFPTSGTGGSS